MYSSLLDVLLVIRVWGMMRCVCFIGVFRMGGNGVVWWWIVFLVLVVDCVGG